MIYDVIIIGGGVSGLFLGAFLKDRKFLILEKNNKVGRKLLLSGAGQCNFTHGGDIKDYESRYGTNHKFIKEILKSFDNKSLVDYLTEKGLESHEREDGKVFPKSMKASDLLSLLLDEIRRNKGQIRTNCQATSVSKLESGDFEVQSGGDVYRCKNLVIATGGKSYPSTGSTGDGYSFAESFGHQIEDVRPSLAPVKISGYEFSFMSGVAIRDAKFELYRNKNKVKDYFGDVLFTHKGLSGPAIINNSRDFRKGDVIRMSLVCNIGREEFSKLLTHEIQKKGKVNFKNILRGFDIPKRLLDYISEHYIKFGEKNSSEISKVERQETVRLLSAWDFEISEVGGYHLAMCTAGGVSLSQISKKKLQSKLVENLYFAGEVIDIDGDTGGYNIQSCVSMAKRISTVLKEK